MSSEETSCSKDLHIKSDEVLATSSCSVGEDFKHGESRGSLAEISKLKY